MKNQKVKKKNDKIAKISIIKENDQGDFKINITCDETVTYLDLISYVTASLSQIMRSIINSNQEENLFYIKDVIMSSVNDRLNELIYEYSIVEEEIDTDE